MTDNRPRLAFYDMDRTITRRGTMSGFLVHVVARHRRWRVLMLPFVGLAGLAFLIGAIDRRRLKGINLSLLVGRRYDPLLLEQLAEGYADRVMARNIHAAALDRIARDRAEGYRIVLATASFRLYVGAIAKRLGIGDVIATELREGCAVVAGPNCYGAEKRALIDDWLAREGMDPASADIRAYSDHISDAPMLALAAAPVATNPSAKLRKLAGLRGWEIVDWP